MKPLTPESATTAVSKLALMAFFPSDPDVRAALVLIFLDMIETEEKLDWLVNRALRLYSSWPGVGEMRALYCSRYKPKDGQEAYSTVYADGIPSERKQPVRSDTPRGEPVSQNPSLDRAVSEAAAKKQVGKGFRR